MPASAAPAPPRRPCSGNLAIIAVTAIVFALVGSAFAGSLPGGTGHSFHLAGKPWNWLGTGPFLLLGLAKPRLNLSSRSSSSFSPSLSPLCFRGARAPIAGGSPPAVRPPLSWPLLCFLSRLIGSGAADGSPSWELTSRSARASSTQAARAPSTCSAAFARWPSSGSPVPAAASSPRKASPSPCPATMPPTCSSAASLASSAGWPGMRPAQSSG